MSEFNVLGFLAFLNGEVSIDDRWFGDAGPIVGGQKRPFWWRQHLPKVRTELYRRQEEIDRLRAELASWRRTCETITDERDEARRQIDEARRQEPVGFYWERVDTGSPESGLLFHGLPDRDAVMHANSNPRCPCVPRYVYAAPVPAQPASIGMDIAAGIDSADYISPRMRAELGMPSHITELATNIRRNLAKAQQHVFSNSEIEPDGEMLDLLNHMDTLAQQIESDVPAQPATKTLYSLGADRVIRKHTTDNTAGVYVAELAGWDAGLLGDLLNSAPGAHPPDTYFKQPAVPDDVAKELPEELFDAHAVYMESGAEASVVVDVLDTVVRMIRARQKAAILSATDAEVKK